MRYVYVLMSLKDDSLYIGYTANLGKRIKQHKEGKSLSTKFRRPFKLIFYEAFINRVDAKRRENYLKSGWGRRSLTKMLGRYLRGREIKIVSNNFAKRKNVTFTVQIVRSTSQKRLNR